MRLFIAIELSSEARKVLGAVQSRLRSRCDGVRWVRSELMHVTLKFLGEVSDDEVEIVALGMTQAAASATPFVLRVGGCNCFPASGLVRTVWGGLLPPVEALTACAEAIDSEMAELGFPRERRGFSPHITVGRIRNDRSHGRIRTAVEKHKYDPVEQPVDSVTLMSSVLSPSGPTYTPLRTAKIG